MLVKIKTEIHLFVKAIEQAEAMGKPWVAFNDWLDAELLPSGLHFFASPKEADAFCERLNGPDDFAEQFFNFNNYHYMKAAFFKTELSEHLNNHPLTTKNEVIMNQKNLEFLSDQLKYNGFGDKLAAELKDKIGQQPEKFQLNHEAEFNGHKLNAVLDFNKSKQSDMYFFNNYKVTLTPESAKAAMTQAFYIQHKGQSVHLKEAYNLMNGRAVFKEKYANKEGQTYQAWLKLDFKELDKSGSFKLQPYNEKYGFKLAEALDKHPIMELVGAAEKERMVQSLQNGNRVAVTFNLDGKLEKRFIEASPTSHGLNLFDSQQNIIRQEWEPRKLQKEGQTAGLNQAGDDQTNKQKNNKRQVQHQ